MPEPKFYVDFLLQSVKEADDARKPITAVWADAWKVFHQQFDYSHKAGWQTKLRWSRFASTIETYSGTLKRAMIEARVWWVAEGVDAVGKERAPLIKRIVDLHLRLSNFIVHFTDGLKLAGIADMIILKATWPQWEEDTIELQPFGGELAGLMEDVPIAPKMTTKRRSGLKVELLDPFKVRLDPKGRNRYVIEESETDYDELKTTARLNPRDWDSEAIGRLTETARQDQQKYEEASRSGQSAGMTPPWRKPVRLLTFWGDVVDEDTGKVERNVTFTVANDLELVGKKRSIPYWHRILDKRVPNKRGPILWGFPLRIPLAPYGKGLARDNLDLALVGTEIANTIGDNTLFAGIDAFEVDKDLVDNPDEFKDGVFPGKVFTKRPGSAGRKMIEAVPLGHVNPELLAIAGYFDRQYQNSTGVTNYVEPAVPQKETTLGEYQGRQGQSFGGLDMIARNLEDQVLEPFLEMVFWLVLQYVDDWLAPEVVEVLGPDAFQLAAMSDAERFEFLKANVRFAARGMSVVLAKQEELQKLAAFIQGLPALMKVVPNLGMRINGEAILRKALEALNWDPDEILLKPQETALEQEAALGAGVQPGVMPAGPNGQVIQQNPVLPQMNPNQMPMMPGGV